MVMVMVIIIIIVTRPRPAFGRLGLGGSSGGYTTHASPRACGARLGQIVQELVEICKNSNVPTFQPFLKLSGKRRNDKTPWTFQPSHLPTFFLSFQPSNLPAFLPSNLPTLQPFPKVSRNRRNYKIPWIRKVSINGRNCFLPFLDTFCHFSCL